MGPWSQLFTLIGIALLGWFIFQRIRGQPQLFTREKLLSSLYTLQWLTLMIIAVVAVVVWFLKS